MDHVLISDSLIKVGSLSIKVKRIFVVGELTFSFTIPIEAIFSHREVTCFDVDEVEYFSMWSSCIFVYLDALLIYQLLFCLIVSSCASPIKVKSFSIEVRRSFIVGSQLSLGEML